MKRTFPKQNPYQTLRISSKHLRQTLRFRPKHLPNTPQKVLRSTLGLLLFLFESPPTPPAAKYVAQQNERARREDHDVAELMALISKMEIIERSSSDPESQAAADRRLERIEKAVKKLNGLDARRDTLEAAVEAADRAEEMARDLEYEVVSAAPDGEQLADDYEELGGGRCAVM